MTNDAIRLPEKRGHLVSELGLQLRLDGDALYGTADVTEHMHVPGTDHLRTSILATWADIMTGIMCIDAFDGRVPVTLDLAIDLARPARGIERIDAVTTILKAGRAVAVADIKFTADDSDDVLGFGRASFMAAPDPALKLPSRADNVALFRGGHNRLAGPFADRVGCRRLEPGVASLARRDDGLNASDTINGGLIVLVAEEAVLSAAPGATLSSLAVHYLRPGRVGPIVGTAELSGELARADVRDTGLDGRLAVTATARISPAAR